MKNLICLLLTISLFLTSCMEAAQNQRSINKDKSSISGGSDSGLGGDGATNSDGSVGGDQNEVVAKVELRHLIQPKVDDSDEGGEYKRKITIPKNYDGRFYLAGINISTLSSKDVKVRFKFGVDSTPITLQGTISTAPGLTPQTNVEVIIVDMRTKPFEDIQLVYDLFDYNNYDFTGADATALSVPVTDNRNDKLYCRGLSLKDDPTFTGSLADQCKNSDDICKYSYAKIVDKGLYKSGTPDIPSIPNELTAQSDGSKSSYYDDTNDLKLGRCLADNPLLSGLAHTFDLSTTFTTFNSTASIGSKTYIYKGPYRPINTGNWVIQNDAIMGANGLFLKVFDENSNGSINLDLTDPANEVEYGYQSRLFPLYTKFNFSKDLKYLGSATPDAEKTIQTMANNGESLWMDGCNERVSSTHNITGEHIGSCNVTATIEIISEDDDTGKITVVDVSNEVKLQLVKEANVNSSNNDVLLSSFQQCSSSSQCGTDSCCINKRCWSKSIVSQCIEDLPSFGNQETGESCTTDYQCSSLCCDKINGRCSPHDTVSEEPSYCSKPSGQSCVAKEWCAKHPVTTCAIVLTGTDQFGGRTCALRCITASVLGNCISSGNSGASLCTPPSQPDAPVFNPDDPNRCNDAITIEELEEMANNPQ